MSDLGLSAIKLVFELSISLSGGRYPRSVTRLSFRRKKKLSLFGRRTSRVDSKTDLMAEEDTGW